MDATPALHNNWEFATAPSPQEILAAGMAPINAAASRQAGFNNALSLQANQKAFAERQRQAQNEFTQAQTARAHQSAIDLMKMHNDMYLQYRDQQFKERGDERNQVAVNQELKTLQDHGAPIPDFPDGATTDVKQRLLGQAISKLNQSNISVLGVYDAKRQAAANGIRNAMQDPGLARQFQTTYQGLQAQDLAQLPKAFENGPAGGYQNFISVVNNPAALQQLPGNSMQEKIDGAARYYSGGTVDLSARRDALSLQAQQQVFKNSPQLLTYLNDYKTYSTQFNNVASRNPEALDAYQRISQGVGADLANQAKTIQPMIEAKHGLPPGSLGPVTPAGTPTSNPGQTAATPVSSANPPPAQQAKAMQPQQVLGAPGASLGGTDIDMSPTVTSPAMTKEDALSRLGIKLDQNGQLQATGMINPSLYAGLNANAVEPGVFDGSIAPAQRLAMAQRILASPQIQWAAKQAPANQSANAGGTGTNAPAFNPSIAALMYGTNLPATSQAASPGQVLGNLDAQIPQMRISPVQQQVDMGQPPQQDNEYMDRMMYENQNPLMLPQQ